jgi:hypothetical protein
MKNKKFKKLLLLHKDRQENSNFEIIPNWYWKEIEFDATPVLIEKVKKIKENYLYLINIPLAPGLYTKLGEIEIPIDKEEEFLKIFIDNKEKIKKIEQILFFKSINKIENLLKEENND